VVSGSPADAAVASLDNLDALPGLSRYVTPLEGDGRFYRIDTALEVPQVDPTTWRLEVGGLVDNPYSLSYDDILATAGFPTELALDGRHAMLAVSMNGQPLPTRHGFPARLVVPGLYGYVSAVKWLKEIRLAPADYDGYWVPRGWSKLGPMKTASRIDVPRDRARVAPGKVAFAGVAWAPIRGVAAVEVQIDGGPWQPARLGGAVGDETWLQWLYEWDATAGKHVVRVRATDKTGAVQSAKSVDPRPDGAEGLHEISVTVA
jgi:hypothetical protein